MKCCTLIIPKVEFLGDIPATAVRLRRVLLVVIDPAAIEKDVLRIIQGILERNTFKDMFTKICDLLSHCVVDVVLWENIISVLVLVFVAPLEIDLHLAAVGKLKWDVHILNLVTEGFTLDVGFETWKGAS